MSLLAFILVAVLSALALVHVLWGVGYWWPIRDERALARAVVGRRGVTRMPGAVACSLVAVALIACAMLPGWPEGTLRSAGLWGAAAVFAARGAAAWLPQWRALVPEQPFATLDRRFYGPLCLAIGAAFAALALGA